MLKQQLLDLLYGKYGSLILTRQQCAEATGMSTATLDRLKKQGLGPQYIKKSASGKNGSVQYPLDAVVDYIMEARNETI